MKSFYIFVAMFFLLGLSSISAQDLIVLKNGEIIEARVLEISPSEIKYKRIEHLDGPTIVINASDVLSIRYENGRQEIINAVPVAGQRSVTTAIDTDRFIFGINANAGGALSYIWQGSSGPSGASVNIELGKGNFNSEINIIFPVGGFGFLVTLNYFWHSRIGGLYLGGGVGYSYYKQWDYGWKKMMNAASMPIGLNIGYKFVTRSGMYFRTGALTGLDVGYFWHNMWTDIRPFYIKPDIAIGWTMR